MRGRVAAIAAGLAMIPVAAEAAMPLPVFLAKADALKKKGPLALFSGDIKVLKEEVQTATLSLRNERLAAKAAGKPQAFCPPAEGGKLGSDELLASLRQIPPAERARMDVREG
ncbi:MAG TPA: hypothetical protein VKI45_08960 [Allosphingosinicella sp.]|nr:hypothetical protein [Allosphingosinicella sp.]